MSQTTKRSISILAIFCWEYYPSHSHMCLAYEGLTMPSCEVGSIACFKLVTCQKRAQSYLIINPHCSILIHIIERKFIQDISMVQNCCGRHAWTTILQLSNFGHRTLVEHYNCQFWCSWKPSNQFASWKLQQQPNLVNWTSWWSCTKIKIQQ